MLNQNNIDFPNIAFNKWPLFWWYSAITTVIMLAAALNINSIDREGVLELIRLSVRCSLPAYLLVFCASSTRQLWKNNSTKWLLVNRKYLGLSFSCAMACQLVFIAWYINLDREGFKEIFWNLSALPGVLAYIFLALMTITSFKRFRKMLSPRSWKRLHKTGIYLLWINFLDIYIESYLFDQKMYYLAMALILLSLWGLRIIAWKHKRY